MCDAHQLARLQSLKADGESELVCVLGRVGDDKLHLAADVVWILRDEKAAVKVDEDDSAHGRIGFGLGISLHGDKKGSGLRGNTSCHPGRKYGIYPHAPAQAAGADAPAEAVEQNGVLVYI